MKFIQLNLLHLLNNLAKKKFNKKNNSKRKNKRQRKKLLLKNRKNKVKKKRKNNNQKNLNKTITKLMLNFFHKLTSELVKLLIAGRYLLVYLASWFIKSLLLKNKCMWRSEINSIWIAKVCGYWKYERKSFGYGKSQAKTISRISIKRYGRMCINFIAW